MPEVSFFVLMGGGEVVVEDLEVHDLGLVVMDLEGTEAVYLFDAEVQLLVVERRQVHFAKYQQRIVLPGSRESAVSRSQYE